MPGIDFSNNKEESPISNDVVSLVVDGTDYKNWKNFIVRRSLAQISGDFAFTTSNLYPGINQFWKIYNGSSCTVEFSGKKVITGYIDETNVQYDANNYNITFKGRDKTSDLIDCGYDFDTGKNEFHDLSALQIITKMCSPFNISVIVDSEVYNGSLIEEDINKIIPKFKVNPGEKIVESITELCQQTGVLPITIGDGKLHLVRAGTTRSDTVLEGGINIKSAKLSQSDKERYSKYYVKGIRQQATFRSTEEQIAGEIEDQQVKRNRTLVINGGKSAVSRDICQTRAAWEARVRAGSSRMVEIILQGFLQQNGKPWMINDLVKYKDDYIGIEQELLIAAIENRLFEKEGSLTRLGLVHPDAFVVLKKKAISKGAKTAFEINRELELGETTNIRNDFFSD